MAIVAPFAAQTSTANHDDWWISLKHGGLLIAPSKLEEFFVAKQLVPLSRYIEDKLRRDVTRLQDGDQSQLGTLLDTVLEEVLGLSKDFWQKGTSVDRDWAQQAITREQIKPRRVWQDDRGAVLPVFVADGQDRSAQVARLGIGRGKRAVSRVIEWLRKADQKVALLTNGYQWRLIHAGADYDAWCEWDINLWFEEGRPGPQVTALRLLLGEASLRPEKAEVPSPLMAAIQSSRQGQAELSDVLGERVRKAVELLIRESSTALDEMFASVVNRESSVDGTADSTAHALLTPPSSRDIYIAASRIIMRCVVILFAEARDLLPRENPIYHNSYGIQGLREQLDRMAGGRASERLRNSYSAWPRMLALFRLVYEGSAHEAIPVPRYGGGLFTPGLDAATDPVLRALAALENPIHGPSDAVVTQILELLCRSKVKVRQGRRSTWVEAPVDFSDLSSEYIGILYEGLLDFELRRAAVDDPMIFLNLGDQPALPLTRLEGMDDNALSSLVEKLKQAAKPSASEEEDSEDEATEAEEEIEVEAETEEEEDAALDEIEDSQDDLIQNLRERAHQWAIRAVKAGKLVNKPRSRRADALATYEQQVSNTAKRLIAKTILPGEWFLVRWGGTRKGSGTFYTRPQLAVPTVQRTLLPLAYTPPVNEAGEPDEMAPMAQWRPKAPAVILALKVCDPACGSASFLIASLRFLVEALWSSLFEHGWLIEDGEQIRAGIPNDAQPEWFVECVKNLPLTVERAEEYSKPRLKRYVVERCIYGVDINPLAVELGRLALWVETMDRSLAFSFLDHKIKPGNSLVGCWFDQFQDYPIMAWEREAGDATHKGVHFAQKVWTKEIKRLRNDVVKEELRELLAGGVQLSMFENRLIQPPEQTHDELLATVEDIHTGVLNPEQQAVDYERSVRQKQALQELEWAFDCWCAVWFWKGNDMEVSPTPMQFVDPSPEVRAAVEQVAQEYQFFHWELEFPGVFREAGSGFDAVVGNPPWETLQPNSKEFFSNIDPLYRTYGKQEALAYQQQYFEADSSIEEDWMAYCANFKAWANWNRFSAYAFGDDEAAGSRFLLSRRKAEAELLATEWRNQRAKRTGYSDPEHSYRYQGEGKPYTYKMFSELSHALLRDGGRFSLIIPSSIYTDKGSSSLRRLFLNRCQWTHLYAFQNERFVFSAIDHRNKMAIISVNKGGYTESIATRFRLGPGDSPEAQELMTDALDDARFLSVPAAQIKRFSPNTGALLEIRTDRDLKILEEMYANGVLLGDDSPQGWGIQYRQGDFNMTSDSKLFPPRPKWEAQGYKPDEYGHWLKGKWQPYGGEPGIGSRESGVILSADSREAIHVNEVEDVALPLYQGVMIHQFNFSRKGWVSGTGLRAIWRDIPFEEKCLEPQFLIGVENYSENSKNSRGLRVSFRDIARSTDERTFISSLLPDLPCGNKVPILSATSPTPRNLELCSLINSFTFDFSLRSRLGGTSLNYFIVAELPLAKKIHQGLQIGAAQVNFVTPKFASEWLKLKQLTNPNMRWQQLWAIAPYERLRIRCVLDAVVAKLYGLDYEDFAWILQDCDHPSNHVSDSTFARTLEPKGFWRVDKEKDPELRHTVLSLIAFHDLKRLGLDAFLNLNNGEGWMLPETLRLADYGLGHGERAQNHQPVASRIGAETANLWESPDAPTLAPGSSLPMYAKYRFLPWQLQGTPADSWAECEMHAENLRRLLSTSTKEAGHSIPSAPPTKVIDNQGAPIQTDLFGNPTEIKTRRKG
ncbi:MULTISPECIES: Eco57I restriction-modification methylase domain-containing protein [Cyanophyceae]|uniref:site-specific DNA-methyltransferase (adenine-specific) n=1 Tax=Leptolyngbya subtilissima DQ-A4 TaxID=2933933 RepID=A0ABV0K8U2_9CYAN|nr:hypothetical protein [Nodosilinea sp. FACHB-141]MBD2110358.1 hypothetical protein [Nodosilinea sp. FACHB-141]